MMLHKLLVHRLIFQAVVLDKQYVQYMIFLSVKNTLIHLKILHIN